MRCEHDTQTATLPGIPELPVKAPRTTQAQRIERMGYEGPKERKRCENCENSNWSGEDLYAIRCTLGDFPVLRGGICDEWTAA